MLINSPLFIVKLIQTFKTTLIKKTSVVTYLTCLNLTVCYYRVTYEFQSELDLVLDCLNVKELLAQSRRHI